MASTPTPDATPHDDAVPHDRDDDYEASDGGRVLVLVVGEATWAVPAEVVRAVVRPVATSALAGAPAWVTGVAAVRGTVLPVADLARRAGVPAAAGSAVRDAWWVVVELGGRGAALAGARVRTVEAATLEEAGELPAASGLPRAGAARLWGEGEVSPTPLPVLDVAAVLSEVHDDGG